MRGFLGTVKPFDLEIGIATDDRSALDWSLIGRFATLAAAEASLEAEIQERVADGADGAVRDAGAWSLARHDGYLVAWRVVAVAMGPTSLAAIREGA